jgi:hypothetical protein
MNIFCSHKMYFNLFLLCKSLIQLECQAEPVEAGLQIRTRLRQAQADILIFKVSVLLK